MNAAHILARKRNVLDDLAYVHPRILDSEVREVRGDISAPPAGLPLLRRITHTITKPEALADHEVVWIDDAMVELVRHSMQTLPVGTWKPQMLPWPYAICISDTPLVHVPSVTSKTPVPAYAIQWVTSLHSAPPDDRGWGTIVLWTKEMQFGKNAMMPAVAANLYEGEAWPESQAQEIQVNMGDISRAMVTLWLLVQQRVAVRSVLTPDRATRRAAARAGKPKPKAIQVITLRRPASGDRDDADARTIEWAHRWLVGGHWRNQWRPSTRDHALTWIAPYVKGPDDKPFLERERVLAWTR